MLLLVKLWLSALINIVVHSSVRGKTRERPMMYGSGVSDKISNGLFSKVKGKVKFVVSTEMWGKRE